MLLADEARSWLGCPYVHQGRNRHGIDCVGLIVMSFGALGLGKPEADRRDYQPTGTGVELEYRIRRGGFTRKIGAPEVGDVLGFSVGKSTRLQHLGIMLPGGRFIHTNQSVGKVVENPLSGPWKRRMFAVWELDLWRRLSGQ